MATDLTIFLDDGGVMSDNSLRGAQWQHLIGEFLTPRLGGSREAWDNANRTTLPGLGKEFLERLRANGHSGYRWRYEWYLREWLVRMCGAVHITAPSEEDCVRLAREAYAFVTRRVRAAFPGVVDTIRRLHLWGYTLHTASGQHSEELEGYLEGMGVRELFSRLYGPDLIDHAKSGTQYYQLIFSDAGVDPQRAVVVDNSVAALEQASQAGAIPVLVSPFSLEQFPGHVISSLTQLPGLLETLSTTLQGK
jgi:phosphoglycolate phosphatase-like HAD superfamily hydrolase